MTNESVNSRTGTLWRSRWAAIGAAVAVSLGAGGLFVARAAPGPAESTIVSVTPERILDTRDPNNVGLPGPFISPVGQKLQVTGSVPTATGMKTVVPTGATGVLLNVTSVGATANGFISIRPGDAGGAPTTSSLNVTAGVTVPNAVQVALPTAGANAGKIDITWDALGTPGPTTDILVDVVGYTTNVDAKFATTGSQSLGAAAFVADNALANFTNGCVQQDVAPFTVRAAVQVPVGVTITRLSASVIDNNLANGQIRLVKSTTVNEEIATAFTFGIPGLRQLSAILPTPEVVQADEYFGVEYIGGDGTGSHQICGVTIHYNIPTGQSVLLEDAPDETPAAGPQSGSE